MSSDNDEYQENLLEEDDVFTSPLYQELLDHCTKQFNSGVPLEELLNFVNDPELVREYFESKDNCGNKLIEEDSSAHPLIKDENPHDDTNKEEVGVEPVDVINNTESEDRWRLSKVIKITAYISLFSMMSIIGHVGICHLLDVNPLHFFPTLQEKRCLLPAHPILMEMTRPIADCGFCSKVNDTVVIEMTDVPSREEFAKVAYLSKPIIIRGGGKGGGMPEGFDFPKLKEIFQSEPGGVDAVSEECQFLQFRSPFTSLREAFDRISENSSWDEPWYIGWSNCHPGVAAKLRELFPRPNFLPEDSGSSAIDWIFIGSPGLGASMHIDYVKRPSWQAQLAGIKRWILLPPAECESSCPESLTFTIKPGDLLFLETNTWYHETFIDGESLSISIGSEYD